MVSTLLLRGMLVGLLAGLLLFAFGRYFGEPLIDHAISFEAASGEPAADAGAAHHSHDPGVHEASAHHDGEELVSRPMQAGLGLFTGVVVYATALGGLFALAFAAIHQRAVKLDARATAALLAVAGFVSVYLVPTLKYPASPPAVGEAATIGYRTALYFAMLACSLAAMIVAAVLRKRLAARYQGWTAAYGAIGFYLAAMVLVGAFMPAVNEVPDAFPAVILWQFRIASLGMQALMWATFGLVFGALTERAWARNGRSGRATPDFLTAS